MDEGVSYREMLGFYDAEDGFFVAIFVAEAEKVVFPFCESELLELLEGEDGVLVYLEYDVALPHSCFVGM